MLISKHFWLPDFHSTTRKNPLFIWILYFNITPYNAILSNDVKIGADKFSLLFAAINEMMEQHCKGHFDAIKLLQMAESFIKQKENETEI